jgi:hypothetical protein
MEIPAAAAFATSSCATSIERPVVSDCAAGAGDPAASSSVNVALNTCCTPAKNSTNRLARVGPSPGVRVSAGHKICWELTLDVEALVSETAASGK